jgi:hypothetical protein
MSNGKFMPLKVEYVTSRLDYYQIYPYILLYPMQKLIVEL